MNVRAVVALFVLLFIACHKKPENTKIAVAPPLAQPETPRRQFYQPPIYPKPTHHVGDQVVYLWYRDEAATKKECRYDGKINRVFLKEDGTFLYDLPECYCADSDIIASEFKEPAP